ncbi:MAG: nitroreductase family protein [Ilumatobacter sp.]|uniref:nitroreductase family protein n=1 Tax=Ilumatobacter sp. TaxID=1967498 RepID=UPI00391BACFA
MEFEPGTDRYVEVVDHALTTTRAVRMRLDLERPVDDQVLLDCIDVAEQAPTGGNMGSRRWMIIRDQATKDRLAELYLAAGGSWVIETAERLEGTDHPNARMMQGAKRLAESIASMPALVIPTIIGRHDGSGRPGLFDSVIQSGWSFMVALRSRGLGTVWTTMYLGQADAVAELLELPDDVTQICLFPVAYTKGVDFSPSHRRRPARDITYFDRFGRIRPSADDPSVVEVVAEADVKARPEVIIAAIADSALAGLRVDVEQIPGGSRIRAHAAAGNDPSARRSELVAQLADVVQPLTHQD